MRTRAYRRAQRGRWIARRLNIVRNIWLQDPQMQPGVLNKQNLTCRPRCGLCKPWKRWPKPRQRQSD